MIYTLGGGSLNINQVFFQSLQQFGLLTFFLPFLLIYSLVFLATVSSGIFSEKNNPSDPIGRKIAAVFSFGFALVALGNIDLVGWLAKLIPNATIWILGLFLLALILALFNTKMPGWVGGLIGLLTVVAFLVIAANAVTTVSSPIFSGFIQFFLSGVSETLLAGLIMLILLIIIVAAISSRSGGQ